MAVMTDELVRDDVRGWIADNWDPDITLAEWWERLGTSGWAAPQEKRPERKLRPPDLCEKQPAHYLLRASAHFLVFLFQYM